MKARPAGDCFSRCLSELYFSPQVVKICEAGEVAVCRRIYNAILTIGRPGEVQYEDQW